MSTTSSSVGGGAGTEMIHQVVACARGIGPVGRSQCRLQVLEAEVGAPCG